jgi:hypothetical protein
MSWRGMRGNLRVTGVGYPPRLSYWATDTEFEGSRTKNRRVAGVNMGRLEIDISLPIVPNHGLGGMELGKNIGQYKLIWNGKAVRLFSFLHDEDFRLDGFNA